MPVGAIVPTVESPPARPFTFQVTVVVVEVVESESLTVAVKLVWVLTGTVIAVGVIATDTIVVEPLPQTFAVPPPPQVWGAVQEPQERVPVQPSAMEPQFLPWASQVVGVQVEPQTLAVPPPLWCRHKSWYWWLRPPSMPAH